MVGIFFLTAKINQTTPGMSWAIVLHGGAGTIPKTSSEQKRQEYLAGLKEALQIGVHILQNHGAPPQMRKKCAFLFAF